MMIGIPGPELDPETRSLLTRHSIGGVILFRRNVRDVEQLSRLVAEIHSVSPERPILVAIDHEGGRVMRLDRPFTHFPPAALLGAAASPHLAYRVGVAMGEELRAVGIDLDFAPVLDVDSNPKNPVIGDRSFGSHPRTVARMGVSLAHGLKRAGVLACGKHFPGHGDTALDSHFELPTVARPLAELERVELFPFRRAIQEGIECLMTAHVVFSALDRELPATLSRRILTDLLRERLHFRGVVFCDDLEMKAIADRWGAGDSAVLALEAGADCLLFCENAAMAEEAIAAVERAAAHRSGLRSRLEDADARIEQLRRTHLRRRRIPREDRFTAEARRRHANLVTWIEERAAAKRTATADT